MTDGSPERRPPDDEHAAGSAPRRAGQVSGHGHGHGSGLGGDRWPGLAGAFEDPVGRPVWLAVMAAALVTVFGLLLLWPGGGTERVMDAAELVEEPVAATVRSVVVAPCSSAPDDPIRCLTATVELTEGPQRGTVGTIEQAVADSGQQMGTGDDIYVTVTDLGDGTVVYSFYEYQRGRPLALLLAVFVGAVLLLGRLRGFGALGGLAASLGVLAVFMLPSLLDGNPAVPVALVAASVIAFIALYLAHGVTLATSVALLGTFASLALTGILAAVFVRAARFTGFVEDSSFFLQALGTEIDARGILLAGIVIGSLGVLDDVTVTQVSAVWELRSSRPEADARELYRRAVRIGRDHISSTVNTLFLAYAGAALPLLLLFTETGRSLGSVLTSEVVATEIVRSLVGSIGLVASVPITTWLAARVCSRLEPADRH